MKLLPDRMMRCILVGHSVVLASVGRHRTLKLTQQSRAITRRLGVGQLRVRARALSWWVAVPARRVKDLDIGGRLPSRAIALTFDDGPDPEVTPKLLELLDAHSARATFFMCGLAAKRHPGLVRSVVASGHSIGGHSWDHRPVHSLSESEWRRQIDDTHMLLEDLSGGEVRWFRPPRGHTDRYTREKLRRRGVATVYWSSSGHDWRLRDPELIAGAVLDDLDPGAIVLLHDAIGDFLLSGRGPVNQEPTVRATDLILHAAKAQGLEPVGLSALPSVTLPSVGRPRLARTWRPLLPQE